MQLIAKLKKPARSLKSELHKRIAGWEAPRPHNHEGTVRASDLMSTKTEFCPREHALMDLGLGKKKSEFVGTSLRMTFDHGAYMERQIRDGYLTDMVVGPWRCGICGHKHPTFSKRPLIHCPTCTFKDWRYEEPRFSSDGISGGIDFLLEWDYDKLRPIELKTMTPEEFKGLVAPLAEHKMRTKLYLKLIAQSTWPPARRIDTREATILYVSKGFGVKDTTLKEVGLKDAGFTPFKEFVVKREDTLIEKYIAQAGALKAWRDQPAAGLPCGICPNGFTKRAQSCSSVSACFSGKHAHVISWMENGKMRHPGKKLI